MSCGRMKFSYFRILTDWKWIYVIPTVEVRIDEMIYADKNFRIAVHFLGWHLYWLWREE